jgi:glutamate-1-semialdehyde 2,1-aminomutase
MSEKGTAFGTTTEIEIEIAKLIKDAFPYIELIRFVNSGTEATMSAIRLARGYTKRDKVVKFVGCYHGHSDFLLVKAGSGVMTFGVPGSEGVPQNAVKDTLLAKYNDIDSVYALFKEYPNDIACVIVEPIAGNMGVVLPEDGFLEKLREITDEYKALLIFDEVITGFRVTWGGVGVIKNIEPDITTLGKIIGGGLPVGAYGGKRKIMEYLAPIGPVYQAGTLSGNPITISAGYHTLKTLKSLNPYNKIYELTKKFADGIEEIAKRYKLDITVNYTTGMLTPFFTREKVRDYDSAMTSDTGMYAKFFWKLIEGGVYPPPSQFEAWFISTAYTDEMIDDMLQKVDEALGGIEK